MKQPRRFAFFVAARGSASLRSDGTPAPCESLAVELERHLLVPSLTASRSTRPGTGRQAKGTRLRPCRRKCRRNCRIAARRRRRRVSFCDQTIVGSSGMLGRRVWGCHRHDLALKVAATGCDAQIARLAATSSPRRARAGLGVGACASRPNGSTRSSIIWRTRRAADRGAQRRGGRSRRPSARPAVIDTSLTYR